MLSILDIIMLALGGILIALIIFFNVRKYVLWKRIYNERYEKTKDPLDAKRYADELIKNKKIKDNDVNSNDVIEND